MQHIERPKSSVFRRSMMAVAVLALFGYAVAYVQAERGTYQYQRYEAAYMSCFSGLLEQGGTIVDCNNEPGVRRELIKHRQTYAVGEQFLNLSVALTLALILSPLMRRGGRSVVARLQARSLAKAPVVPVGHKDPDKPERHAVAKAA